MTYPELKERIRTDLGDEEISFYSDQDILDSAQDGYDEIAVYCGSIIKIEEIQFQSNLVYYNFKDLISDFFSVVSIFNKNTNRWLEPTSELELDDLRSDWELWVGEPQFFFPHSTDYVGIVPHHSTAVGSMEVHYRAQAPAINNTTRFLIHDEATHLLEDYVKLDLLEQAQEYVKAADPFSEYIKLLTRYANRTKQLGYPDYRPGLRG